jgi:two-component system response regulator WspF
MKIAIVNGSLQAVEVLRRSLTFGPAQEILWTATTGAEAVSLCARFLPDLILMGMSMSDMDGAEATRQIMATSPCAIVMVSASVDANSERVFEAMGQGALDAVDAPVLGTGDDHAASAMLLRKVSTIARLIGDRRPLLPLLAASKPQRQPAPHLIAIGASSGGPTALAKLLGGLPPALPAAIVIVQHIDQQFAAGMANWLSQYSALPVRLAIEGDLPSPGIVLLAGTSDHLALKPGGHLGYTSEPSQHAHKPSIDVFFNSVNRNYSGEVYGVLLTGMGRDGAAALKALRDKGHYTVTQDEASSAVYGMPKAAAELSAAVEVLPLPSIAPRLVELLARAPWRGRR